MEDFFLITNTRREDKKLAFIGLCTEGEALDWWKAHRRECHTWEDVKRYLREYYGDHYRNDKAYNKIVALRLTGTVQQYLNEINMLNVDAGMTDHHLINIILNGIPSRLRLAMAHYENLRPTPHLWRKKLLEMDVATTEFAQKDQGTKGKDKGKKRGLEDRVQMRGGEVPDEKKKKGEFVPKETWEKRRKEGRCLGCGRIGHSFTECRSPPQAKTPPPRSNPNQEPIQKKRKFDKGHLKLTELGSGEESGNE